MCLFSLQAFTSPSDLFPSLTFQTSYQRPLLPRPPPSHLLLLPSFLLHFLTPHPPFSFSSFSHSFTLLPAIFSTSTSFPHFQLPFGIPPRVLGAPPWLFPSEVLGSFPWLFSLSRDFLCKFTVIPIELEYRIPLLLDPSHLHPALPAKWMLLVDSNHFVLPQATCQDQPQKLEPPPPPFFATSSTCALLPTGVAGAGVGCISCAAGPSEPVLPLTAYLLQGLGGSHGAAFAMWPAVQLQLKTAPSLQPCRS